MPPVFMRICLAPREGHPRTFGRPPRSPKLYARSCCFPVFSSREVPGKRLGPRVRTNWKGANKWFLCAAGRSPTSFDRATRLCKLRVAAQVRPGVRFSDAPATIRTRHITQFCSSRPYRRRRVYGSIASRYEVERCGAGSLSRFISGSGAWPLVARAQQPGAIPRWACST